MADTAVRVSGGADATIDALEKIPTIITGYYCLRRRLTLHKSGRYDRLHATVQDKVVIFNIRKRILLRMIISHFIYEGLMKTSKKKKNTP